MSREIRINITGKKIVITNENGVSKNYIGDSSREIADAVADFCHTTYTEVTVTGLCEQIINSFLSTIEQARIDLLRFRMRSYDELFAGLSEEIKFLVSGVSTQEETQEKIFYLFEDILDNNCVSLPEPETVEFKKEVEKKITEILTITGSEDTILIF